MDAGNDVRWLSDDEQLMWRAERRVRELLDTRLERQLIDSAQLSLADYHILVPLSEHPEGVIRARELVEIAGWNRSRLSHQVRRMASRGLVEKLECPTDRRGMMVKLTDKGRQALEDAAPGHVTAVRELYLDRITPEERDVLARVYGRLIDALED